MIQLDDVEFNIGSKEEVIPGLSQDAPYITARVCFDRQIRRFSPWHWHKAIELFYVVDGALEYYTPNGHWVIPAGSGGMVNSNVLHMTELPEQIPGNVHLLHFFDASFIAGAQGSRIEQKYVLPVTAAQQLQLVELHPENPMHAPILDILEKSFRLPEDSLGYELKLRGLLSEFWLQIFSLVQPVLNEKREADRKNDKIKSMMVYIHEHYAEKISVSQLAAATFSSERECYRLFRDCLHMTPVEYITAYRLQIARHMLVNSSATVTEISHACCLGSSSYFGKLFHEHTGYSPSEYRRKWQDNNT
ncbi:helix-turn-helix domain-containing protein [Butyricicoccus sp.]|uniref:helix-turn-helix domain-containing protein n=1 Tax=Butyricicoccus sp. TaxID=2049021 RepID=UPI003F183493